MATPLAVRLRGVDAGNVFVVDDLTAWLIGAVAEAGFKALSDKLFGTEQERTLKQVARVAVQSTVTELCGGDTEQAERLAANINHLFKARSLGAQVTGQQTLLEALKSGVARQLAGLDNVSLTGAGKSPGERLDISPALVAQKLSGHLVDQIMTSAASGSALAQLADQLNHDKTHLGLQELSDKLDSADEEYRMALTRLEDTRANAAEPVRPRLLPRDVSDFTGRKEELKWLLEHSQPALNGAGSQVLSITGMPSVGKSALAIHFAHWVSGNIHDAELGNLDDAQVRPFDDAQLYVDLRPPARPELTPDDAITTFLRALGVTNLPDDDLSQQNLYRSLLADRRALIVLDDAQSSAQVRPLLPSGPHCLTLITSRAQLSGLEGTDCLQLNELAPESSLQLLRRIAGDDLTAEQADLAELAQLCGYLPLALRIAAAKLRDRHWPAGTLVARLSDERRRLAELQVDDLDLRSQFNLSYQDLNDRERCLFRRAFVDSPVTSQLAAALIATDEEIAAVKARQEEQDRLIQAEADRLAASRRATAEPPARTFALAAEVRCTDALEAGSQVFQARGRSVPDFAEVTPPLGNSQASVQAIHQVLQDVLPKDADITPTADGFIVRASIEAPSDNEAFRTLSVPVCHAGPVVDINALVRDPEGHVSEFMDGRTAHGPSFDYFLLRDQVREQALADARQALGGTVPYLTCDEAEELLAGLASKQLAQPVTENSYSIHDLLRDFAHDMFAHDDQISEEDLWTRYSFCADFLDETADTTYEMATASPSQSLESPVEEAKRQQRIAATADHLGVSDWITPLPWPPGWPAALPAASDPATSDPGNPAQGDM